MSVRLAVAGHQVVDDSSVACAFDPSSMPTTDIHRIALAFTDALMTQPGEMSTELVEQLRSSYSPEQLVELTLKVLKFNMQKPMVALGIDFTATPELAARFPWAGEASFIAV
jgi:alkylhydroperoxidase family enzyme